MARTRIIGITGGIGSGKSVVSRILRCQGYNVYDCDAEAKAIMDASCELKQQIAERLGEDCLLCDGSLNRPEIAKHVFSNESNRLWLNNIVHDMVRRDIQKNIDRFEGNLFFIESAILKSSGLTKMCDSIWVVTASDVVRILRVKCRDKMSDENINARMNSQRNEFSGFQNIPVAHIHNDGDYSLLKQLQNILN